MGAKSGVTVRGKKSIQLTFHYNGTRCRETINLPPTPRNILHCKKWKARIEHEIATNTFEYKDHFPNSTSKFREATEGSASVLTIGAFLKDWLTVEEARIKHSTWLGYKKIFQYHLIPSFGNLTLGALRRKHLYEWADQHPTMSAKRARNILSPLRVALKSAIKRELITENPFTEFTLDKRPNNAEEVDPFTTEERTAILNTLNGQEYNLILFAFWTGLRTSELIALDWADIDWIRGVIMIRRTMTQGMTAPIVGTKTRAGHREVTLLSPALQALTAQKTHTFIKGAEVFQRSTTKERWNGDQVIRDRIWTPALKRAGVRYRNPYQTRHTYASMMLMAGEHVMWVAKQMGHTDWSLTAKRYARWQVSEMPDAGKRAVEKWWNATNPPQPAVNLLQGQCRRGDSNPHAFRRHHLKMVRLPIPPLRL